MQRVYSKSHNKVSLNDLSFEVISYKVDHVKMVSSYITMSNDTGMYVNGVKPYILTLKGYFPKSNGISVLTSLEELIHSQQGLTFTLSGIEFQNVELNRYSFKEVISNVYQEFEISFMGVDSFSTTSEDDEDE
ncbi:MAG: hypothetical protein LIO71_01675 [Ruminococcus sp.]|nr:hypothetical protein [Ruminococcus sp.]